MSLCFRIVDRHLFSVKPTKMVVPSFGNNLAIFDQNAAY
jgi:hypothetical protein